MFVFQCCRFFVVVVFVLTLQPSLSQAKRPIDRSFVIKMNRLLSKARQDFATRRFDSMRRQLVQAEDLLKTYGPHPGVPSFDNAVLWYHLLRYKYFMNKGALPPSRALEAYHDKQEIQHDLRQLQRTQTHFTKGLFHLEQYNKLFRSLSKRLKTKEALALVNTLSQEGILRNRLSIVKLRVFRLKRLIKGWKRRRRVKLSKQDQEATKRLKEIRKMQLTMKKTFKTQALRLFKAQNMYDRWQRERRQRALVSQRLHIAGWIGVGLGVVCGVSGVGLHLESDAWVIQDEQKKYSPVEGRQWRQAALASWITGGALLLAGVTSLITSAAIAPSKQEALVHMYRSQQIVLEQDDKDEKKKK